MDRTVAPGRAAQAEGDAAREAGAVPGTTAAAGSDAEVLVWCHACRGRLAVPGWVLDQLDALADVTCGACMSRGWEAAERAETRRWARRPDRLPPCG